MRTTLDPSHDTCLHAAAWAGNAALVDDEHHSTAGHWAEVSARVTNQPACTPIAERLLALEKTRAKSVR